MFRVLADEAKCDATGPRSRRLGRTSEEHAERIAQMERRRCNISYKWWLEGEVKDEEACERAG